jgi:hypothetical protein
VPVDDPAIEAMWDRFGSPWGETPLAERLTAGRPALWGSPLLYIALGLLFLYLLARLVQTVRALDEEPGG